MDFGRALLIATAILLAVMLLGTIGVLVFWSLNGRVRRCPTCGRRVPTRGRPEYASDECEQCQAEAERARAALPTTIDAAVDTIFGWKWVQDPAQVDYVRSLQEDELCELHFSLGMAIRNSLGLTTDNRTLLDACDKSDPDDASMVLLRAVHARLISTASAADMQRAAIVREHRAAKQSAYWRRRADFYADITKRRCTECGAPCPTFRKTCIACGYEMGRE
jgi:hypothetical protein